MSKSFVHQHIKNIKKQRDSSAISVSVKTTPITPIAINQDNITSSNLTVVIKEISRIKEAQQVALKTEEDRIAKEKELAALAEAARLRLKQLKLEQEAAEKERIRQEQLAQKQEEARLLREAQERRLAELERARLAQEQLRKLEEDRIRQQQLEIQRLAILEQQRLERERIAREEEDRQRVELERQRLAREVEERLELERQRLVREQAERQERELAEQRVRLEQERLVQEQQATALQLLQPIQILAPEIPVEAPVLELQYLEEIQPHAVLEVQEIHQDIQEPLEEPVAIAHIEPEPLLPPPHPEEQPLEIIAAVPLEQEPVEHQQEPIIEPVIVAAQVELIPLIEIPAEVQHIEEHNQEPEIPEAQQEPLALIAQPLIVEVQSGGEESDSEDLDCVSDFSNVSVAEEWEYVMGGLAEEHQEL